MCAAKDVPRRDTRGGVDEPAGDRPAGPPPAPTPPPGGWPSWVDPARDLVLTPRRLRGLVHPIRVRLLFLLEADGPATASQLGRRIGHSSGVTSYHLRTLAELGFVAEAEELGNGRDRWWRPTYRYSSLTARSPDDPGDPESIEVTEQLLRLVADSSHERMLKFVDGLSGRLDELPTLPWTLNNYALELTHDEARELTEKVDALLRPYHRHRPDLPDESGVLGSRDGTVRAVFQFQVLPDDPAPAEEAP